MILIGKKNLFSQVTDRDGHKKKMNHKNPNKEQPWQTMK